MKKVALRKNTIAQVKIPKGRAAMVSTDPQRGVVEVVPHKVAKKGFWEKFFWGD